MTGNDCGNPGDDSHLRFVELFSRHQRDIQAYIRTLVPSKSDADDVMQDTSTVLWQKFAEYDSSKDFGRWGCGIAHIMVLRLRRKTVNDKLWFNEDLLQLISCERLDERGAFWEARREALQQCVASLDPGKRRYLELRFGKGWSVEQMSCNSGRPVSTVYRIIAKLRKSLLDCVTRKVADANRT